MEKKKKKFWYICFPSEKMRERKVEMYAAAMGGI